MNEDKYFPQHPCGQWAIGIVDPHATDYYSSTVNLIEGRPCPEVEAKRVIGILGLAIADLNYYFPQDNRGRRITSYQLIAFYGDYLEANKAQSADRKVGV